MESGVSVLFECGGATYRVMIIGYKGSKVIKWGSGGCFIPLKLLLGQKGPTSPTYSDAPVRRRARGAYTYVT